MKTIKLDTNIKITQDKKGNIKTLSSPFDNDSTINQPIFSQSMDNDLKLRNLFKGFGESYLSNLNN